MSLPSGRSLTVLSLTSLLLAAGPASGLAPDRPDAPGFGQLGGALVSGIVPGGAPGGGDVYAAAGDTEVWDFDVTITTSDVTWTSPTSVDPGSIGYDTDFELTVLEGMVSFLGVPFGPFDLLDGVDPADLMGSGNVAGPAPITLVDASIIFPPPPEPTTIAMDLSSGIDATGTGFFSALNVVLGQVTVDLGFPFGEVTADIESIRIAGTITITETQWVDLGQGLAGTGGLVPLLTGTGLLLPGDPLNLALTDALPLAQASLVVGFTQLNAPLKGGVLVPDLDLLITGLSTDATGSIVLPATWPAGVPAGFVFTLQWWMVDAGGVQGFSASNGESGTAQ